MIGVMLAAVATILYRIRKRQFTKAEAVLLAIFAVNWIMIELQIVICDHRPLPGKRYWVQAGILMAGWAALGTYQFSRYLSSKFPRFSPAKYILGIVVACFALSEIIMLAKAHIPVGRRYAYVQVVDWAAERIKADWKGPSCDEDIKYFNGEYRIAKRPIISCHTGRLPFVLNARNDSASRFFADDTPDYICDEEKEIDLNAPCLHGAQYELMDKIQFGKRKFALYKRVVEGMAK